MYSVGPYIISSKDIPRASMEDTLGSVLGQTKSSYDGVFVYDSKGNFEGIVTPSRVLFKKRLPPTTKVGSCIIHPPHLTKDTPLYEAVHSMLSNYSYTLPIFDDEKVSGVISATKIIESLLDYPDVMQIIKEKIVPEKPLFAFTTTQIKEIYPLLKRESRAGAILLHANSATIEGLVTRYDIQKVLTAPTRKMRSSRASNIRNTVVTQCFEQEKIKRLDYQLTEIYNPYVVTLSQKATLKKILSTMLEKKVNSIILVDFEQKPIGVISLYTILRAIMKTKPQEEYHLDLSTKKNLLSENEKRKVTEIINRYVGKIEKSHPLRRIKVRIDGYKNIIGSTTGYRISIAIQFIKGGLLNSKIEDKHVTSAVRTALKKIEKQLA